MLFQFPRFSFLSTVCVSVCVLFHVGYAVEATPYGLVPVRVLLHTYNLNYAPINIGTTHISQGTVYIRWRTQQLVLSLLSAID